MDQIINQSIKYQVEADPETLSFPWTLSNGRETTLLPREMSSDFGLTSILVYTPRRDADFGELQCWALNDIGKQKEPCRFKIVKEGISSSMYRFDIVHAACCVAYSIRT